jgi:hypothetical protein
MQEKTCQYKLIFMHKKDNFQIHKSGIQTNFLHRYTKQINRIYPLRT